MQCQRYEDGGFVLHKIIIADNKGLFSAWYLADGTMEDCEKIVNGKVYRVAHKNTKIRAELKKLGPIWKNK